MTTLRSENTGDIAVIAALTRAAFAKVPHSNGSESAIVDALRAAGALTVSLVADVDGQLVGHVAISPVSISDGSHGWYGLGPVSVLPAYQGRGIGTGLINQALAQLQAKGAAGCVVLGEPGYYQRFGFTKVPGLQLPGVPTHYFQARCFGSAMAQGTVAYHPGFAATG